MCLNCDDILTRYVFETKGFYQDLKIERLIAKQERA